ncbi:hypothetical protein JOF56_000475 [Kibdelosporangium banguiense]|uniref:Lipoprotein n=1 Tax=Kibdelosporangium banguiense TaxID=1365924 RepID=A0ABS4T7L6_9PSEU|nr:hypothetical protein [Kibdelosporangium banguiense]MBP2320090.1 hypothetical protein [Kibdelosporangium banguiense]
MRTRLGVLTVVAVSVLALAGCQQAAVSGSPQPGNGSAGADAQPPAKPDSQPSADPKALISNAAKTTRESTSCKFEWKAEAKAGGDTGVGFWTSTGAMDFKNNRSTIESVMDMGGPKMKLAIISDGTTIYVRTVADGAPPSAWKKMDIGELEQSLGQLGGDGGAAGGGRSPGRDPMSFIDEIKEVATVTPDGSDTVRGVPTTRYIVTVDPAKSPLGAGEPGSVKLWTDAKNRLARFQVGISGDGTIIADFFAYDEPVKIDVPAADEVEGGN